MTSAWEIRQWFNKGVKQGSAFMLVCSDTFDWTDYPVYVPPGINPYSKHPNNGSGGMGDRVMECYNLAKPWPEVGSEQVRDYGDWERP